MGSVANCIEWVAIGFEIVDSHFADWRFTAAEAVADFGVHAALVVGTPWRVAAEDRHRLASTLESLKVSLSGGKDFRADGAGRNALGNPLLSLAHLARVLATQPWAAPLESGEVITTGTLTPLPNLRGGSPTRRKLRGRPCRRCGWSWATREQGRDHRVFASVGRRMQARVRPKSGCHATARRGRANPLDLRRHAHAEP